MLKRISYRDPDGYIIATDTSLYRIVYTSFQEDLLLIEQNNLLADTRLVRHTKLDKEKVPRDLRDWLSQNENESNILAIFQIEKIFPISYAWEWTISMLKDAALLTLDLQRSLIPLGLTLKDANSYNIQFVNGKPVFIDLLSIKKEEVIYPWHAYGQFLRHFSFPLILAKYNKLGSMTILGSSYDGINKQNVSNLVPFRSYFNVYELLHVHLLRSLKEQRHTPKAKLSFTNQSEKALQLVSWNHSYISRSNIKQRDRSQSVWIDYVSDSVEKEYKTRKDELLKNILSGLQPTQTGLDLGANTGEYSELLLNYSNEVISLEEDSYCCEEIYKKISSQHDTTKKWMVINSNLLFPSPGLGWMNTEYKPLIERISSSLVLSLALIHHIYFKGSIYFDQIASLFNKITLDYLVVEFVSVEDDKVKILKEQNSTRLADYNMDNLIFELSGYFSLLKTCPVNQTRTLLLFEKIKR